MQLLVGADPEVFVKDASGRNISGHGMVPGTKKTPFVVTDGAVQVDGTALEFNIDPAKTEEEFVTRIIGVMKQLKDMIPEGHSLDTSATVEYERAYFEGLPKYAKRLGCAPDYDAYTGYEMARGDAPETLRTAAGHLHLGWTEDVKPFSGQHFQSCRTITRELDCHLGLASVLFDEKGQGRRMLYGQAGAFRPKPYGVEYRVLSNSWLQDPSLMAWVYKQSVAAFERLCTRGFYYHRSIGSETVQAIINDGNGKRAFDTLVGLGAALPPGIEAPKKKSPAKQFEKTYASMTTTNTGPAPAGGTAWPTWTD